MNHLVKRTMTAVEGERSWGRNSSPFSVGKNICNHMDWDDRGYTIEPFLSTRDYLEFIEGVKYLYVNSIEELGVKLPSNFKLEDYHKYTENIHYQVVEKVKYFPLEDFPIDPSIVIDRISQICGKQLTNYNPITKESVFHFRTVRPMMPDYNPIHRDNWHEDYEDCINIYVGLSGSNALSSLPVEPGSHYWTEDEIERTVGSAVFNGIQFTVPGVTDCQNEITLHRPNPSENEVMVFSPYTIHGGGSNLNTDQTRISLEMRFWEK